MAKRALGMGIDALLGGENKTTVSASDVKSIALDLIDPNPNQPRKSFNDESLEEMAESIRSQGVIQPVILEPAAGRYTLVAGERRFRAARLAELHEVPAIIRQFNDEEKLEIALIENVQREDLNPIEEAEAYSLLMEKKGLSQADVAAKVGKQRSTVANSVRLLKLPKEMKDVLARGGISSGHARALLSVENPERRRVIFDRIMAEGLSVREAEALAEQAGKAVTGSGHDRAKNKSDGRLSPELKEIQEKMIGLLGTKVSIKGNDSHGKIEIAYFSMDDLERITEIINSQNLSADGR